jgi:endonuclease YncB( thermonuclease family)
MLWAGMLGGLLWVNLGWWIAPVRETVDPVEVTAPDPWAESRRSADILRGQEGAPSARDVSAGQRAGRGATVRNAAVGVIDGDTFRVGGETIRIADIDTPETHPPRCAYEAELGERATRRLTALLSEGPFELSPIGGRDEDRYGRKLRVVTRGGRSLGDVLVSEGLARTWTGRREPWC